MTAAQSPVDRVLRRTSHSKRDTHLVVGSGELAGEVLLGIDLGAAAADEAALAVQRSLGFFDGFALHQV
jgi:acyl CoA:acetate/3-ketoacid CoA transferase